MDFGEYVRAITKTQCSRCQITIPLNYLITTKTRKENNLIIQILQQNARFLCDVCAPLIMEDLKKTFKQTQKELFL